MKATITWTIVVILGILIGGGFTIYHSFTGWAERGQFGDMFGAANALFSSLALVGVIVAILLQKQELSLQRLELQETRRELERSAKAQEDASRSLAEQIRNQMFASRLDAMSSLLSSFDLELDGTRKENFAIKEARRSAKSSDEIRGLAYPQSTSELESRRNSYRNAIRTLLKEANSEMGDLSSLFIRDGED